VLTPRSRVALNELVELLSLSKTDVINRAIQLYRMIENERGNGNELLLRDPDGQIAKVTIL
jgi:hypothetical protein